MVLELAPRTTNPITHPFPTEVDSPIHPYFIYEPKRPYRIFGTNEILKVIVRCTRKISKPIVIPPTRCYKAFDKSGFRVFWVCTPLNELLNLHVCMPLLVLLKGSGSDSGDMHPRYGCSLWV